MKLDKEQLSTLQKKISAYKKKLKGKGRLSLNAEKVENELDSLLYSCGVRQSDEELFLKLEDDIGMIIDECFKRSK